MFNDDTTVLGYKLNSCDVLTVLLVELTWETVVRVAVHIYYDREIGFFLSLSITTKNEKEFEKSSKNCTATS